MYIVRFGQVQNRPNQFGQVRIFLKELPKLAQNYKKFAKMSSINLPKLHKSLSSCCQVSLLSIRLHCHCNDARPKKNKGPGAKTNLFFQKIDQSQKSLHCNRSMRKLMISAPISVEIHCAIKSTSQNGTVAQFRMRLAQILKTH